MSNQASRINILVLGASYGLLFAARAALGGHRVDIVGRVDEVTQINRDRICVNFPARRKSEKIEISEHTANLDVHAIIPSQAIPQHYDIVVLAMQENQFLDPEIYDLAVKIAESRVPVLSVMNMALPPYLKRLDNVWHPSLTSVYHRPDLWERFDPANFSHSSPDPQAIRTDASNSSELTVTLGSNFKIAPFKSRRDQNLISQLCRTANAAPNLTDASVSKPSVYFIACHSEHVPLAKWPMLMTGNYRCITDSAPTSIRDAVHQNLEVSEAIYDTVTALCRELGARDLDMVSFASYAKATRLLIRPSSVARALEQENPRVERMDILIEKLLGSRNMGSDLISQIVNRVSRKMAV